MIRPNHIKLIASYALRNAMRGGTGIVTLVLTMLIGLGMANAVITPLDAIEAGGAFKMEDVFRIGKQFINWAFGSDTGYATFLLDDKPALISSILLLLWLVVPMLTCVGAGNQTADDIANRGLRFVLLRTERSNIFFGRFLGALGLIAAAFGALLVVVAIYCLVKIHIHGKAAMLLWLAEGYLRMMLFALPYIALGALASTLIANARGATAVALVIAYVFPLAVMIAASQYEPADILRYATPWGWKWRLLGPLAVDFWVGAAAMLGFTGVFLWAGHRHFLRRDL